MQTSPWHLEERFASFQWEHVSGTIDAARPTAGLRITSASANRPTGLQVLGISDVSSSEEGAALTECHVRGNDFVAAYQESAEGPICVDALWRVLKPGPTETFVVAVEMRVSVWTQRLSARPELIIQSRVPATETLRLVDVASGDYEPVAVPGTMESADGLGCVVFRLPGVEASYAEMVHPADFLRDELGGQRIGSEADGRSVQIGHRLFSQRLEKGVILCARLRGVVLPRAGDTRIAAESYRCFTAAEPPLGT